MICTQETYDVLTKDECDKIINFFLNKTQHHVRTKEEHRNDTTLDAASHDSFTPLLNLINERMRKPLHDYFTKYHLFPEYDLSGYKIQLSGPGGGFTGWHHDGNHEEKPRMVWMIYLNDVETGHTEFMNAYNKYRVKCEQGKLFLFPADFTHMHRSAPDLDADKYIITGWVHD